MIDERTAHECSLCENAYASVRKLHYHIMYAHPESREANALRAQLARERLERDNLDKANANDARSRDRLRDSESIARGREECESVSMSSDHRGNEASRRKHPGK